MNKKELKKFESLIIQLKKAETQIAKIQKEISEIENFKCVGSN
jgi:chaperonin cofactor prefoldin